MTISASELRAGDRIQFIEPTGNPLFYSHRECKVYSRKAVPGKRGMIEFDYLEGSGKTVLKAEVPESLSLTIVRACDGSPSVAGLDNLHVSDVEATHEHENGYLCDYCFGQLSIG